MYSLKIKLIAVLFVLSFSSCSGQQGKTDGHDKDFVNHLEGEKSPYLLQHMRNPVDWYPWKDEALVKAVKEDKLLIISVGYSACHWCHVMEHESFEDAEVAVKMNTDYVSIKVDREERPDIDDVYMTACQIVASWSGKGSCGWPLNVIALPDGRPIFAGTYFPKSSWLQILAHYQNQFAENRTELEKMAEELTAAIAQSGSVSSPAAVSAHTKQELDELFGGWESRMDLTNGGRTGAPKFPMPINLQYLLKYNYLTGNEKALDMVTVTLDKMAAGGIYDQIGGGFARYSVDGVWKVPHFEKMLYDNGQLVSLYANAFALTGNPRYEEVVRESLVWIAREMTSPENGFYSSLDADSEGEEGKFYVWTEEEIEAILAPIDEEFTAHYIKYYLIRKNGNWEEDKNILHYNTTLSKAADGAGVSVDAFKSKLKTANTALLKHRASRIRPGLDDKILSAWNGLMLIGYVDAYKALGDKNYLETAIKNAEFIKSEMIKDGYRLNRNYKDGESGINAFLDDYALVAEAFTALYQVTFDEEWLTLALGLTDYAITHFYDPSQASFFYTSDLDPKLITRKKELDDNVIAASNSIMARNLLRLSHYYGRDRYKSMAEQLYSTMHERVVNYPVYSANWAMLLTELVHPSYEVAVLGKQALDQTRNLQQHYLPDVLYMGATKNNTDLEILSGKMVKGQTTIYVCRDRVCKLPVTEIEDAINQIKGIN